MSKEELFYIQTLKDFIHGNKTTVVNDLNWQDINSLAISQNTNGIVFYQCKDFIPKEYLNQFNSLYMSELYNYGMRVNYTNEIKNAFENNNIDYFLVKGLELSKYYSIPALRTMGDSDFIVKDELKEKAYSLVEGLGYSIYDGGNEKIYYKNKIEVEIHHKLLYADDANKKEEVEFFEDMFDHVQNNKLDPSYHFIFLIFHLKKHILRMGCGFRQFMDLAIIAKNEKLNWNYINDSLNKLNLLKFKNVSMSLVYKWFDYKFEDSLLDLDDDFYEQTTLNILKNGVHGWDNEENDLNLAALSLNNTKDQSSVKQKVSYLFMRYFPSYDKLRNNSTYSFVNNKPYLLPVAWLYRFYLSIKNKKAAREVFKTFKGVSISKQEANKRLNTLEKWGL